MALTQVKTLGIADDAVTEAKVANDAISPTEMKAGTDGHIITYDASGNPTTVGPGTDGQVLTSTGAGSPPAFEALPTIPTLSGSTNNQVVTVTGANAIQGETKLTFDGATLQMDINNSAQGFAIEGTGNHYPQFTFNADRSAENNSVGYIRAQWNDTDVAAIDFVAGADTTNKDDGKIRFQTRPSGSGMAERMRIESDGNVKIVDGDLVIGTSGHGIDFSATGDASGSGNSMSNELLDDYEEGTWTPKLYANGSDSGVTYGSNHGVYTKIGNLLHLRGQMTLSDKGNGNSGDGVAIGNFPYTIANIVTGTSMDGSGVMNYWHNLNSSFGWLSFWVQESTTYAYIKGVAGDLTTANNSVNVGNLNDNSEFRFAFTYHVA